MMEYKNSIIAELTQLEDYARTCFVQQLKLPNGQGKTVNEFINSFMQDLTDGELWDTGLVVCLDELLPDCRNAIKPQDTRLYNIVIDWIHDNLHKCEECGEWYNMEKDGYNNGLCQDCQDHRNASDPDTVADFLNDLEREQND